MIEVTKTSSHVLVNIKLNKRLLAKEKKIYLYSHDAHKEAINRFPDLKISSVAEEQHVISNISSPHEATWKFAIEKEKSTQKPFMAQEKTEEKSQEKPQEKKSLQFEPKRARLEKKEESKKDPTEQQ